MLKCVALCYMPDTYEISSQPLANSHTYKEIQYTHVPEPRGSKSRGANPDVTRSQIGSIIE